jgi:hypothetical protein
LNVLEQFFGGYFHQDCFDDDPTWEDVVQQFRSDATPEERLALAAQIEQELLSERLTEDELDERLWKLGAFYDPKADGLTHRQWLIALISQLRT